MAEIFTKLKNKSMTTYFKLFVFIILCLTINCKSMNKNFEKDTIKTSEGNMVITFVGHASLFIEFKGMIIHIDPVKEEADYSKLPKADIVLVTHEHFDHFDTSVINQLFKPGITEIVMTQKSKESAKGIKQITIMQNGDIKTIKNIKIEAVPAYNIINKRPNGMPFHPKGEGNGYIITLADKRIYIAGDTENTPEMKDLKNIDIAFLPMNMPYTMTPEMVADAAKAFKPKILYPYHFGSTQTSKLVELMKNDKDIEIRIRNMQ